MGTGVLVQVQDDFVELRSSAGVFVGTTTLHTIGANRFRLSIVSVLPSFLPSFLPYFLPPSPSPRNAAGARRDAAEREQETARDGPS